MTTPLANAPEQALGSICTALEKVAHEQSSHLKVTDHTLNDFLNWVPKVHEYLSHPHPNQDPLDFYENTAATARQSADIYSTDRLHPLLKNPLFRQNLDDLIVLLRSDVYQHPILQGEINHYPSRNAQAPLDVDKASARLENAINYSESAEAAADTSSEEGSALIETLQHKMEKSKIDLPKPELFKEMADITIKIYARNAAADFAHEEVMSAKYDLEQLANPQ